MCNKFSQFGKDWEEGVNFERLRRERLQKTREAMGRHGLQAMVVFAPANTRYITGIRWSTFPAPGVVRYTVLPIEGEPVHFELGGDYGRVKENTTWMEGRIKVAIPIADLAAASDAAKKKALDEWASGIKKVLKDNGASNGKIGFDLLNIPMIEPLENANIKYVDGTMAMLEARMIKTQDELQLLRIASRIADAGFYTMEQMIRPGVRESEIWAEMTKIMMVLGAESVTGIFTSGGRTNPYYRLEGSDRILGPGDLVISDICAVYMGYYTCVVRTFVVGNKPTSEQKALYRECYDYLCKAVEACKAGVGTDKVAEVLPGGSFEDYSLQIAHGVGLSLHEIPRIIRVWSKDNPIELKPNMYLAMETYAGKPGGNQGVRLEENYVITENGYEMFSRYPFDEKML